MAEAAATASETPSITSHLKRGADGKPYISGVKCGACGHTYLGDRTVCAKCYARDKMQPVHLAEQGKLYTYSIVHRSFPGIETPFIDVIVDLDDGAHIKGILRGVDPDPAKIGFDMRVKVDYREVVPGGAKEKYLAYYFVPENG